MTDREKIIRALERAKRQSEEYATDKILVPFKETDIILTLLKEQEPVEPYTDDEGTCSCGNCGINVGYYPVGCSTPQKLCNFCPECGRRVKWE